MSVLSSSASGRRLLVASAVGWQVLLLSVTSVVGLLAIARVGELLRGR